MTVLRPTDRNTLMKGMVLRRLRPGAPLTREQLDVGIGQDIIEIKKRFSTFDFESYVDCTLNDFYNAMEAAMLVSTRAVDDDETLYERGSLADDFDSNLSEDMEWFIDELPMSTRGFFDKLKQDPKQKVQVDINDLLNGDKRIVEDTRHLHKPRDHQLRAGPTGKK